MFRWLIVFLLSIVTSLSAQEQKQDPQEQQAPEKVYIIPFEGAINHASAESFRRKIQKVDPAKAKVVIVKIDTPGGVVQEVLNICRQIDSLAESGVPVYVYIIGHAWSGGALISLAADKIYMKPGASIGSAQVKMITPQGMVDADEKTTSAVSAEFRAYAEKRNYPPVLAEAMVDPDISVMEISVRGERRFVKSQELISMRNDPAYEPGSIIERGVAVAKGKLANFTAQEAKNFGFCRAIYKSEEELLHDQNLDQYPVEKLSMTVEDKVAGFLANRWVRFLLIAVGILGLLIEFSTPGFGLPGIVGLLGIALFFLGGYIGAVTEIWEIVLFVIGVFLLAVEIFVIPGFGVAGISGILMCFFAMLLSFQTFVIPQNREQVELLMNNLFTIIFSVGLDIALFALILRFLPENTPILLSNASVQKVEEGYSVAIPRYSELQGKSGVSLTQLRPSGRVEIEGEPYDVVSDGSFIESGSPIEVLEVHGNRIVVTEKQQSGSEEV